MGRTRRLQHNFLMAYICLSATYAITSCIKENDSTEVEIRFHSALPEVRSGYPDENLITDISLLIFDETGAAEECIFLDNGLKHYTTKLVTDKTYRFCACANFGYPVYADHIDELQEITYRAAYPDEYRDGIPMSAEKEIFVSDGTALDISLKRLMAKISLRMDRSLLDEDVEMNVRSARIGNCPRYVTPFRDSRNGNADDSFPLGFSLDDVQTADLNFGIGNGLSKEVSLYMFENMQGRSDMHIGKDSEKVFDTDDHRKDLCSYIELEIEYMSDTRKSGEEGLIYRFYLGEDRNSFDVRRNTHYHITVTPENDGLSENSWRVDQSGLEDMPDPSFRAFPSDYIRGDIGDKIHIWCEFTPEDAPFDPGISYMEDDKAEGIYDYILDEDGHGAVLTLTGPGRGLIYMEAGEPVNDAALFIIEVNQP